MRNKSVIPVPSVTEPLRESEELDKGLCQKLEVLRVPSAVTARLVAIA
jgi:hypothetical protein